MLFIKNHFLLFIGVCFFQSNLFGALCTATVTGNWESASTWSCGRVPLCTDNITIPVGYTVTITSNLDYNTAGCTTQTMVINLSGQLTFQTGSKISLPAASYIVIQSTGRIQPGGGGGSSNLITIGGNNVWRAGDGAIDENTTVTLSVSGLPIELLNFNCSTKENSHAYLSWQTASETNNHHFEVEKSIDGINFNVIANINGAGNSSSLLSYNYTDINTTTDDFLYYRLKQVDDNGKNSYSGICYYQKNVTSFVNIYPNPIKNELMIEVNNIDDLFTTYFYIYDITGKEISIDSKKINNKINIDCSLINNGFYLLKIKNKKNTSVHKIVIQH